MVIFDSFCFDLTMFSLLMLFFMGTLPVSNLFMALLTASLAKSIVQENLLTFGQPVGFNWYFPGLYSLMVPYHDICDFWYSGHISTALILIYGLRLLVQLYPDRPLFRNIHNIWLYIRIVYIYVQMTFLRTHFVIDMSGGVVMAGIAVLVAEKLSYCFDVMI